MTDLETINQVAERIVRNEVYACLSNIVWPMAKAYGDNIESDDLAELVVLAAEIYSPVLDYEEAARAESWIPADLTPGRFLRLGSVDDGRIREHFDATSEYHSTQWHELCEAKNIEPFEREVFEVWAVSSWLADQLALQGEKIENDFAGFAVWSRTTTGQAISMDCCIQRIAQYMRLGRASHD